MNKLTKKQIEDWRSWCMEGHTMEFGKILASKFIELCDLALQSLSLESVRSEALQTAIYALEERAREAMPSTESRILLTAAEIVRALQSPAREEKAVDSTELRK